MAKDGQYAEYFRVQADVDISDTETHDSLVTNICEELLAGSPLCVRVGDEEEAERSAAVKNLLQKFSARAIVRVE